MTEPPLQEGNDGSAMCGGNVDKLYKHALLQSLMFDRRSTGRIGKVSRGPRKEERVTSHDRSTHIHKYTEVGTVRVH